MYQAPDFVKVTMDNNTVFGSKCDPGTQVNNVDFGGSDLSGCQAIVIAGMVESNCYFLLNQ